MYRTIEDFLADWKRESKGTLRLLGMLTDESLSRKVTPEGRSLGFIGWHLALTVAEMANRAGLVIPGPPEDAPAPEHAAEITETYRRVATALADAVKTAWDNGALLDELDMYGDRWKKGFVLAVLIRHEAHHRGQMTVLMRQAGLRVPGVCGPSREEWEKFGMLPQK